MGGRVWVETLHRNVSVSSESVFNPDIAIPDVAAADIARETWRVWAFPDILFSGGIPANA